MDQPVNMTAIAAKVAKVQELWTTSVESPTEFFSAFLSGPLAWLSAETWEGLLMSLVTGLTNSTTWTGDTAGFAPM